MLRHPAAVIDSKQRWYGGWQGEVGARGGLAEPDAVHRARDARRAAGVRPLRRPARATGRARSAAPARRSTSSSCARASPAAMRRVHEFVDRGLSRSAADWERLTVPEHAARAGRRGVDARVAPRPARTTATDAAGRASGSTSCAARTRRYYAEAEAVAQSSIAAARTRPAAPPRAAGGRPRGSSGGSPCATSGACRLPGARGWSTSSARVPAARRPRSGRRRPRPARAATSGTRREGAGPGGRRRPRAAGRTARTAAGRAPAPAARQLPPHGVAPHPQMRGAVARRRRSAIAAADGP